MPPQVWRPFEGSLYIRLRSFALDLPPTVFLLKARQQAGETVLDAIQRATQSEEVLTSSAPAGEYHSGGQPDTAGCMPLPANGAHAQRKGTFEGRTEEASADLYFHYYSLIQHQCAPWPHCPQRSVSRNLHCDNAGMNISGEQCRVTAALACAHNHALSN